MVETLKNSHKLEVDKRERIRARKPQRVVQQNCKLIKKDLRSTKRPIFTVSRPSKLSPTKSRASLTDNFVVLAKWRRLVVVPALHQHGLRELQPLGTSGIIREVGSSQFPDLDQFWPVTQTPGLTGSFVALEELYRLVVVAVLHQHGLRELQRPRSSGIN